MKTSIALEKILVQYFQSSCYRIDFIARFVVSLIQVKSVLLSEVATSLNPDYCKEANYRRIQRFMSGYSFNKQEIVRWTVLDKRGNSSQLERINFITLLLSLVPLETIKAIVADREFIGAEWFRFLNNQKLKFHIRIRKNMLADIETQSQHVFKLFVNQPINQPLTLHQRYLICGQWLAVTGMKLQDGSYIIVVTNGNPRESLELYKQRWGIEEFFKAIKKTGFDFEDTHLVDLDRISNLLALVTIAFTWAHRMGEFLHDLVKPITMKNHGYKVNSFFRHGLDYIRSILNHYHCRLDDFYQSLTVLTCR